MSRTTTIRKHGWRALTAGVALSLSTLAVAAGVEFVPYAGKRDATLVRVDAPDRIVVTFDSDMIGFVRTLTIKVPGIVVAQDTPRADDCERAAAKRAMSFTENFLADAKKIYVKDVRMTNAADDEGVSPILTDKGSLSAALIKEGIARPDTVDPDTPWCK